ncbi:MAG TPA: hypothetical protein VGV93_10980 [Acidimicrobiales bacterium]|nr:hypothetical protein [Acidimicrobiales bacterium]
MRRSAAGDRMLLALLGLVALVVGGYGLARNLGAFGAAESHEVVLGAPLRRAMADNAGWVGGVATFVALTLAWSGWRWLRRQLVGSSSTVRRVRVAAGPDGHTSVEARALVEAVVRDVEAGPQVRAARVRLAGPEKNFTLDVVADLAAAADPQAVRRHVEDHVVPRARAALEREDLASTVRLRLLVN